MLKVKIDHKTVTVTREQRDGDGLARDCKVIMAAKNALFSSPIMFVQRRPSGFVRQWDAAPS